jgi:hypothetical protein
MPMFYDHNRSFTTSVTPATEITEMGITPGAGIMGIYALYGSCRFNTAGGAALKLKSTATLATGGAGGALTPKYARNGAVAATLLVGALTGGGTPIVRQSVGLAQTGGSGGWQALMPQDAFQATTSTVGYEIATVASSASVPGDIGLDIGEGL